MRFRSSKTERLSPGSARRQGDITRLAILTLGRDAAIEFMNGDNAELGGRPIDLAIASEDGCRRIESVLGEISNSNSAVSLSPKGH